MVSSPSNCLGITGTLDIVSIAGPSPIGDPTSSLVADPWLVSASYTPPLSGWELLNGAVMSADINRRRNCVSMTPGSSVVQTLTRVKPGVLYIVTIECDSVARDGLVLVVYHKLTTMPNYQIPIVMVGASRTTDPTSWQPTPMPFGFFQIQFSTVLWPTTMPAPILQISAESQNPDLFSIVDIWSVKIDIAPPPSGVADDVQYKLV
jgi:hypothetical protein